MTPEVRSTQTAQFARDLTWVVRVPGRDALEQWVRHFDELGVAHGEIVERAGRAVLPFTDPEGQRLELVDDSIAGDVPQVDLPRDQPSGLIQVQSILEDVDGISFVRFGHQDVVRHQLVQRMRLHQDDRERRRVRAPRWP